MVKRIIHTRVLPGEPTDGHGRVCVHLFVLDEAGKFVEPNVLHPLVEDGVRVKGKFTSRPTRGRLACDPNRDPAPVVTGNTTLVTPRTTDIYGVNCPRCLASSAYQEMLARFNRLAKYGKEA